MEGRTPRREEGRCDAGRLSGWKTLGPDNRGIGGSGFPAPARAGVSGQEEINGLGRARLDLDSQLGFQRGPILSQGNGGTAAGARFRNAGPEEQPAVGRLSAIGKGTGGDL